MSTVLEEKRHTMAMIFSLNPLTFWLWKKKVSFYLLMRGASD
jgi:hypothetical protein